MGKLGQIRVEWPMRKFQRMTDKEAALLYMEHLALKLLPEDHLGYFYRSVLQDGTSAAVVMIVAVN